MKKLIPKNLTHRGTVSAEVFLLSADLLSEAEMRRRALELYRDGARIFRLENDLIVRLPQAVSVDSRRASGLPFVRYGAVMAAFPLTDKDLSSVRETGECLLFWQQGILQIVSLSKLKSENIESWFDVADFQLIETETLGAVVESPTVMKTISEESIDLRENLGDVPPADSQMAEILTKLKEFKAESANKSSGSVFSDSAAANESGGAANLFASVFGGLKNLLASAINSGGAGGDYKKTGENNFQSFEPPAPGVLARIYNRLRNLSVNALIQMRLGRIFGRRQAKYLAEMMEKFERGDLSEALKYAIPLEDMDALRDLMQTSTALFTPRPRTDLTINLGNSSGNSTINLEAEWFARLEQLYRQSFERLEAQGRFEEAAFVLAELLKKNAEAVDFLAKHGKYRLAAELAEARNLPKEVAVRQWFLAGEKNRAVRLAILHDCFEYAVAKLEQQNAESGADLREIWAQSLANGGNFAAAVDVIWKLENKRETAREWLEKAIEFGGVTGARMLAKKMILFGETDERTKGKFREIARENESQSVENRAAFARAVFKQNINPELQTLLRVLTRKIAGDVFESSKSLALKEFRELVALTKDNALRADLPVFPQATSPVAAELFELKISAADRGASLIRDACALPNGKIAVALGEAGVKILARDGKTINWFDQPAQKLIVSDFSSKAIALAKRGQTVRLARVDFAERRAEFWCDAKIDCFAPNFDGNLWFVGLKDEFYAIDANGEKYEALWNVPDVGAFVYSIARSSKILKFLTHDNQGFESWWYELPSLTLRHRDRRKWLENDGGCEFLTANISEGSFSIVLMQEQIADSPKILYYANFFEHENLTRRFDFPAEMIRFEQPVLSGMYSAVTAYADGRAEIYIFFGNNLTAQFLLEESQSVSTRFDENSLTLSDDCGRLLVYDYTNRILRQNLRN